jgi:hypothetical protein
MDTPRADVGWIVGASLNVIRLRALDLALIALPLVWAPNLAAAFLPPELAIFRTTAGLPGLAFFGGASLLAYREMTGGDRVTALGAIAVGLKRYFTLFMINAVSTLMALVASILLVVPGLLVLVSFMTATTAAVAEDKGSTAALERAWRLSRGSRGRLAALLGIAVLAEVVLLLAGAIVIVAVAALGGSDLAAPVGRFVLGPVIVSLLLTITTVGAAATYVNLRTTREGPIDVADAFA